MSRTDPTAVQLIPHHMVVMGVAGSGKSSVGAAMAVRIGAIYFDGDDLHPPANIKKMSDGIPLTNSDRMPWLTDVGHKLGAAEGRIIVGCSALKRAYRDRIITTAGRPVTFIYLAGTREVIAARIAQRTGHFMPTALLDSQFATLEEPATSENAVRVEIDQPLAAIVKSAIGLLQVRGAGPHQGE